MRKCTTDIIVAVLLLLITVSVVIVAYIFILSIKTKMSSKVEEFKARGVDIEIATQNKDAVVMEVYTVEEGYAKFEIEYYNKTSGRVERRIVNVYVRPYTSTVSIKLNDSNIVLCRVRSLLPLSYDRGEFVLRENCSSAGESAGGSGGTSTEEGASGGEESAGEETNAEEFTITGASIVWKTQWNPTSRSDYAYAVCSDGKYIYVVGCAGDEGDDDALGASILIAKINSTTGNVIDYMKYEPYDGVIDDDYDCLYDCVIVGNYLYAVGVTASFGNYGRHLVKIDLSSFTKVSEYNYDLVPLYWDFWYSIDSDGTYLYVGGYYQNGSDYYFIVQKLDLNGNIVGTFLLDAEDTLGCRDGSYPYSGVEHLYSIKYYNGSVYFAGGYACKGDWDGDGNVDDYDYRMVVVKLNASTMNMVSSKVRDWVTLTWEGYQMEQPYQIDIGDDGYVYVVGEYDTSSTKNYIIWKLDYDLNNDNYTTVSSSNETYYYSTYKIKYFNGYLLIFGNQYKSTYVHHAFMIYNSSLKEVYRAILDNNSYDSYFGMVGRPWVNKTNATVYVAGYDYTLGDYEWTVYKVALT